ncbi:hypothetical protein M885DRAFT_526792 [Pelagophyceae sp. CCMP2097]|nr:hypothetical protein M885DRAFT_526792 [Pelagophyceae sp. CCMP2097]
MARLLVPRRRGPARGLGAVAALPPAPQPSGPSTPRVCNAPRSTQHALAAICNVRALEVDARRPAVARLAHNAARPLDASHVVAFDGDVFDALPGAAETARVDAAPFKAPAYTPDSPAAALDREIGELMGHVRLAQPGARPSREVRSAVDDLLRSVSRRLGPSALPRSRLRAVAVGAAKLFHFDVGPRCDVISAAVRSADLWSHSADDLAMFLWSLAKVHAGIEWSKPRSEAVLRFEESRPALVAAVLEAARVSLDECGGGKELSLLAWAAASLGSRDAALFDAVAARALRGSTLVQTFQARDFANMCWAFARAERPHPGLFEAVARAVLLPGRLGVFLPQELAALAWAFSRLEVRHSNLFDGIASQTLKQLRKFSLFSLANTAWAYAKAKRLDGTLRFAIAEIAIEKLLSADPTPNDASQLAWAFAQPQALHSANDGGRPMTFDDDGRRTLVGAAAEDDGETARVPPPSEGSLRRDQALFAAVSARVTPGLLAKCDSQQLGTLAWAFSKSGALVPQRLYDIVATNAISRLADLRPRALAEVAWAFAHARVEAPELLLALGAEASRRFDELNSQDVATVAWALVAAGLAAEPLLDRIVATQGDHLADFTAAELGMTAWAFATSNHARWASPAETRAFLDSLACACAAQLHRSDAGEVALVAWAFSVLYVVPPPLEKAIDDRLNDDLLQSCAANQRRQLHTYLVHLEAARLEADGDDASEDGEESAAAPPSSAAAPPAGPPPSVSRRSPPAWAAGMADGGDRAAGPSPYQLAVSAGLTRIGFLHQLESHVPVGCAMFRVDMALPSRKCAVHADGPHHYLANDGALVLKGPSLARDALLQKLGWWACHVPFFEWARLEDDYGAQDAYLRAKVAAFEDAFKGEDEGLRQSDVERSDVERSDEARSDAERR